MYMWKRHFALFAASEYTLYQITRETPSFYYINIGPEQAAPARKSFPSFALNDSLVVDYSDNNLRSIVRSIEALIPLRPIVPEIIFSYTKITLMPMCTPRLLAPSFESRSRVAIRYNIEGEKDKIESDP
ncbi:hypothetical protein P5V15_000607 [Pogonomyrmex californicus]